MSNSESKFVETYPDIKPVSSLAEVNEITGNSPASTYRDIRDGKLIANKNNGKTVVLRENLIAYIRSFPRMVSDAKPKAA